MTSSLLFRMFFPTAILLPMVFMYGGAFSRNDPWGLGAWLGIYLPFIALSLVANYLIARVATQTVILRTLLYFFLPFLFYGLFLTVEMVLSSEQITLSILLDKLAAGIQVGTAISIAVLLIAPAFLVILGVADYFLIYKKKFG